MDAFQKINTKMIAYAKCEKVPWHHKRESNLSFTGLRHHPISPSRSIQSCESFRNVFIPFGLNYKLISYFHTKLPMRDNLKVYRNIPTLILLLECYELQTIILECIIASAVIAKVILPLKADLFQSLNLVL